MASPAGPLTPAGPPTDATPRQAGEGCRDLASALHYSDGATQDGAVGDYSGKVKQISLSTGASEPGS
jgi:hypothetical protein